MTELSLLSYNCPNCAANVQLPKEHLSTLCSFCDSPLVQQQTEVTYPELVAKFILTQKNAGSRLKEEIAERWFLPKELKERLKPEELKGVYIPFWMIDAQAHSQYQAEIGIHWYEEEEYTTTENGKTVTKTRRVRRTEWHSLSGTFAKEYSNYLVCGSTGISSEESMELQPFDVGLCLDFTPVHIGGWVAENFTLNASQGAQRASDELRSIQNSAIRRFLPGDEQRLHSSSIDLKISNERTVLLPIWIATYPYKGQVYRLLVNGQTGEVVGALPKDKLKIALLIVAILLIIGILVFVVGNA